MARFSDLVAQQKLEKSTPHVNLAQHKVSFRVVVVIRMKMTAGKSPQNSFSSERVIVEEVKTALNQQPKKLVQPRFKSVQEKPFLLNLHRPSTQSWEGTTTARKSNC